MEVKTFTRFLQFALVSNVILVIVTVISVRASLLRIQHFKPRFPVSEERILTVISSTTTNYLHNYLSHDDHITDDKHDYFPKLFYAPISISSVGSRTFCFYRDASYTAGDYIDVDGMVMLIQHVDFERQRLYCLGPSNAVYIVVSSGVSASPDSQEAGDADTPSRLLSSHRRNAI